MDLDGSVSADRSSSNADRTEEAPVEDFSEVAGQQHVATFLRLTQSMPCSIRSGERLCGRGATLGAVIPNPDGTWLLMPICAQCSKAMAVTDEAFAKLI